MRLRHPSAVALSPATEIAQPSVSAIEEIYEAYYQKSSTTCTSNRIMNNARHILMSGCWVCGPGQQHQSQLWYVLARRMELLGFQILYSSTGEGRGGLDDTLTCVGSTIFNARIKTFFCPENGDQDPAPRVEVGQWMTYGTIDVSPEFPTGYCRARYWI